MADSTRLLDRPERAVQYVKPRAADVAAALFLTQPAYKVYTAGCGCVRVEIDPRFKAKDVLDAGYLEDWKAALEAAGFIVHKSLTYPPYLRVEQIAPEDGDGW